MSKPNPTATGRLSAPQVDPAEPVRRDPASTAPSTEADIKVLTEGTVFEISDDEIEVKTSGAFMLMDPVTGKHFDEDTAVSTRQTQFVAENLASGKLVKA